MSLSLKMLPTLAMGCVAFVVPAKAGIVCDGQFQIINGQAVSTPYCEDEQLAHVLRSHGAKTCGDAIRRNAEFRRQSCLLAANDEAGCANYTD
jgi:hypothetical protein